MAEYAAYGTELKIGTQQTHYATIVCDTADGITGSGNGTFAVIASGMTGADIDTDIALLDGDLPADVARKAAVALNAVANIAAWMTFYAVGNLLYCRLVEAAADDATLEIEYKDTTCAGLTDDATGTPGATGVAEVAVAQVTNISGPGLAVDTEDVTTHDQATAWEETVATIIRSGEVSLDLVFDPVDATHDAATGLLYRFEDKIYSFLKLIFPDAATTEWEFSGYITGFEPAAPSGGALTATAKAKITSQPLLA